MTERKIVSGAIRALAICLVLFSTACATTYKEFDPTKLSPSESPALGKVRVIYNGKARNPDCVICLSGAGCQKLTEEGFVFVGAKKGLVFINRVECKDVSIHHHEIKNISFTQTTDPTYFGEIEIHWKNRGGFKVGTMFGAIGAAITETIDDGEIDVRLNPGDFEGVRNVFEKQTRRTGFRFQRSLISKEQ